MKRREMLTGLAASALTTFEMQGANDAHPYIELKIWRLHNSEENQPARVADYLGTGLGPALSRSGAKLIGVFSNVIGPDGPFYITLVQFDSLAAMQESLTKVDADDPYERELNKLGS